MTDPTLIADLIRAGVDPDLVGRVANAIVVASADRRQTSADASADGATIAATADPIERRRERDRAYQKHRRLLKKLAQASKANDVDTCGLASADESADASADAPTRCCNFLSSSLSEPLSTEKKESKRDRGRARARGSRLEAGATINEADWQFALGAGLTANETDAAWPEFVDYWIAVPGERGTKCNWSATWRNRVRELMLRKVRNGHIKSPRNSLAAVADEAIARAKERDRTVDLGPGDYSGGRRDGSAEFDWSISEPEAGQSGDFFRRRGQDP